MYFKYYYICDANFKHEYLNDFFFGTIFADDDWKLAEMFKFASHM